MALTYQRKYIACGKASCRKRPDRHGPYWYAFWWKNNKTHCKYIGKNLPEHLEDDDQVEDEIQDQEVSSITVRRKAKKEKPAALPFHFEPPPRPAAKGIDELLGIDGKTVTREIARKAWWNRTHKKNLSVADLDAINEAWVLLRQLKGWK